VRGFRSRGAPDAPTAGYPASAASSNGGNGGPAVRPAYAPIAIARSGPDEEERIPLRGMRRRIAESMARPKQTGAHFTFLEAIDMTELVAVRERAKGRAAERGVKLQYLPFIVKAV